MTRSVPGLDLVAAEGAAARALFDDATPSERYQAVLAEVAVPYRIDAKGRESDRNIRRMASTRPAASSRRPTISRSSNRSSTIATVPCRSSFSTLDKMWSNQNFSVNERRRTS